MSIQDEETTSLVSIPPDSYESQSPEVEGGVSEDRETTAPVKQASSWFFANAYFDEFVNSYKASGGALAWAVTNTPNTISASCV
jgi:hypothetical protein